MKNILSLLIIVLFAIKMSGQCYPDRHNTTWFDAWTSCEKSQNPNEVRGNTHWIMYDFGHTYKLEEVQFWNLNDPDNLDSGIKYAFIDYSIDGSTWTFFGRQHFNKATGKSIYEGDKAFEFNGAVARYVLLTVDETWGGDCAGFSEIKIAVSPINSTEMVNFDLDCDDKNGYTVLSWSLENDNNTTNYDIQRSYDNITWSTIYTSGNIAKQEGVNIYKYSTRSDKDAYYRIIFKDAEGNSSASDPVFCSLSKLKVKVAPNPFNNSFDVEILAQNNETIFYKLTDVLGRIVKSGSIEANSIINELHFKDLNINQGNYFLLVRQGVKTSKLLLTKI